MGNLSEHSTAAQLFTAAASCGAQRVTELLLQEKKDKKEKRDKKDKREKVRAVSHADVIGSKCFTLRLESGFDTSTEKVPCSNYAVSRNSSTCHITPLSRCHSLLYIMPCISEVQGTRPVVPVLFGW